MAALTQAQIAAIQRSASLGQAQLYARAWGVSSQQLADILRTSPIGRLLPNIAEQHRAAGTPVPKQALEFKRLLEKHPQETKYDVRGAVKTSTPKISEIGGEFLSLSDKELQELTTLQQQATSEADRQKLEPRIYKVGVGGRRYIFVEGTSESEARSRAEDAGYDVTYTAWRPTYTAKIKDGKTGRIIEFNAIAWNAWGDKYKNLVKTKGFDAAMKEFKQDYYELADGAFILKTDFDALPERYAEIATTKGFAAMMEQFEADHVQLGDGQWIPKSYWENIVATDKKLGTNVADIGKSKGYDAMVAAANKPYEEFLEKLERGDIIAVGRDEYITKEEFNKLPSGSQEILKKEGFYTLEHMADKYWQNIHNPSTVITDARYKQLCDEYNEKLKKLAAEGKNMYEIVEKIGHNPANEYHLDSKSGRRALLELAATVVRPAKAALPEYTIKDVTPIEWALAGANVALIAIGFAPGAIAGSTVGNIVVTGLSSAIGGMVGYETAKNWSDLSHAQRAMSIGVVTLCAIPLITTVARNVKIGTPQKLIPTVKGQTVAWKGLSVAGHPIIGRSGGKWVLGTRSITLPEARMILNGYHPETMLETKVFVNKTALQKAGFTNTQIEYLTKTLKNRNLFAGKSSLWLDKNVLIEPTQRLSANEISIIQQQLAKLSKGKLKDAYLLYGSPTIKAQLAPELRGWRALHDWDISLNMNQARTEAWTKALFKELKAKGGATYRINPEIPTLIEKKVGGTWEHIADIHSQEAVTASAADISASKLDATGEYSYGRMVSEPAITVKYPGEGELYIMRLSESGVRKTDTILRVRQTTEGTAFKPPERGIAQPGVPKDAADFYVILRNYELSGALSRGTAEEWLESWAKAMGYTEPQLRKVLPKLRQSMLDVAANTPSSIIGYKFKPASSPKVSPRASPSIVIRVPSSLGASVSAKLESKISKPIYPYKLARSPKIQAATSAAISSYVAALSDTSLKSLISKAPSKVSPMAKVSPKPSPSPSVSTMPSPSPKLSPSIVPKLSPSVKPSPSAKPSKAPSPTLSPKPSPTLSPQPVPSPKPSPYPYPSPKPGPKPKTFPIITPPKGRQKKIRQGKPLAVWDQGMYYVTVFPPFRTKGSKPGKPGKPDVVYSRERPHYATKTAKGKRSPQRSLQTFGRVPKLIEVPMGVVTARIRNGRKLSFSRRNGRRRGRVIT